MKKSICIASIAGVLLFVGCGSAVKLDSAAKDLQIQKVAAQEIKKSESQVTNTFVDYSEKKYEYYLTREELLADIEQGIIFRVDTTFQKPMCPLVTGGDWAFYVHENNIVNLEISYSNLIAKNGKYFYPYKEQIIVDVLSPNGDCAYHFEKQGDEIMQDTSIREQIAVTPGQWKLQIGFAYVCDEVGSHFKIGAAYESPSKEDLQWLREERLKEHNTDDLAAHKSTNDGDTDFELTEPGKEFLENICKTVNDFDSGDKKDEAFWKDFLFLSYTGLWEDEAEIVKIPREDLGMDEPVVKVSLEEAQAYARLVFGEELPDLRPTFDEMQERQTSFFFAEGNYYIGTSDFPDYQFRFADCTVYEEEGNLYAIAKYNIDFEGENNVGTVRLTLVPAKNENGFVVIAKERKFLSSENTSTSTSGESNNFISDREAI